MGVVCVVLLVLFYMFFIKDNYVKVAAGYEGIKTGAALRLQERSQGAGFQSGYEAPVFWGTGGGRELADWNSSSTGINENSDVFDPNNMDKTSFNTKNNYFGKDLNEGLQVIDSTGKVFLGKSSAASFSGKYSDSALSSHLY